MHILIIYQYFGTPKGGWSTRMYEMPKRWVAKGHKVTIVTAIYDKSDIKKGRGLVSEDIEEGIHLVKVNISISNKHSKFTRITNFVWFALVASLITLISKHDLIIASSGPISVGFAGLISGLRKKKVVFEVRDLWPQGAIELGIVRNWIIKGFLYRIEKLFYRHADLIVTCSVGMAINISKRYPGFRSKLRVIPNGSDLDLFSQNGLNQKEKLVFVYTGSVGLMDDCMQIVEAARELQNRTRTDIRIKVIGDGSELEQLVEAAKGLNNIEFTGLIPKVEVKEILVTATGSIITFKPISMLNTSSPNKFFDALASGVPVIQTTNGWIKDLIDKEHIGINVDPNNPVYMADSIELLADDKKLRSQMSKNARRVAEESFDREKLSIQYLEDLRNLVE